MKIVYDGKADKAFKNVLGETIPAMAAADKKIVYLDADLANCINMGGFIKNNPTQGFDCGIAEANMIGIAAGLSSGGFKPIVHSFGPFASRRCFDQVFLSVGYAKKFRDNSGNGRRSLRGDERRNAYAVRGFGSLSCHSWCSRFRYD